MPKRPDFDKRKYLSINDCAQELGVARVTVWRYIQKGGLPAVCPGGVWRIKRRDWNLFLHGRVEK